MTPPSARGNGVLRKASVVLGGYVLALAVASAVVAVRLAATRGPDAQASAGMYAFGDLILFAATFGIVGLLPTALGLVFLRPCRLFWLGLSAAGLVIATTGAAAVALFAIGRAGPASSPLGSWAALAVLRILPAPLVAGAFLIAGLISPHRASRWALLAASGIEVGVCAYAAFAWLDPGRLLDALTTR
jgi:hypothetical protein